MINKKIAVRFVLNAASKSAAKKILNDLLNKNSLRAISLTEFIPYEDEEHYEAVAGFRITGNTPKEIEYNAFRFCALISKGPWLFLHLPDESDSNDFNFEAIFNPEAFINHLDIYNNNLKWAHLEIF